MKFRRTDGITAKVIPIYHHLGELGYKKYTMINQILLLSQNSILQNILSMKSNISDFLHIIASLKFPSSMNPLHVIYMKQ